MIGIKRTHGQVATVADHPKRGSAMHRYDFRLILKGTHELTEEICDELFAAGCDDGTPGTCEGVFLIDFHREAAGLEAAIRSVIRNVQAAGYEVERVEIEPTSIPQSA